MMTTQQDQAIEQIELTIEEAQKTVAKAEMARRLSTNRDFQKLVMEDYWVEEAARLTHLFTDPQAPDEVRQSAHNDMIGVGGFKRFMSQTILQGNMAAQAIEDAREDLEYVRSEEFEEEEG